MRVFVYEYLTAEGIGRDPGSPDHAMYLEGRAMRDALGYDFARFGRTEVSILFDEPAPAPLDLLQSLHSYSDWCVLIAPETDSVLETQLRGVKRDGGKALASSPETVRLTSDKLALAQHWRTHGVPTPATSDRAPTPCELFPVVWKPRDGAGATDTYLIRDRFKLASALAARAQTRPMILQEFVPGTAASVAFLCGPREKVPLVPALQLQSADGRFKYEGGELPIPPALADRAVKLACAAVACVPGLLGYVGVDVVLGVAPDGSRDYAIEINPRLTTSYIGLRALADFNIAEAMLKIAEGEPFGPLKWKSGRVRFGADGTVVPAEPEA